MKRSSLSIKTISKQIWNNHNQLVYVEAVRQAVEDLGDMDLDVEAIEKYEVSKDELNRWNE